MAADRCRPAAPAPCRRARGISSTDGSRCRSSPRRDAASAVSIACSGSRPTPRSGQGHAAVAVGKLAFPADAVFESVEQAVEQAVETLRVGEAVSHEDRFFHDPGVGVRAPSVASEPPRQLDVEGVQVDVADPLEELGGPGVGQGLGQLVAPGRRPRRIRAVRARRLRPRGAHG